MHACECVIFIKYTQQSISYVQINLNTCDVYERLRNGIYDITKIRV